MFERRSPNLPRCLPVYPIRERVKGVLWGLYTGVFTTIAIGWMTEAPWLTQRYTQLLSWLSEFLLLLP